MNTSRSISLLEDLAKLLKKHGPGAFEELAAQLRKPGFVDHLNELLVGMAKVGRTQRRVTQASPRPKRKNSDAQKAQELIAPQDPEKDRLLGAIRERLCDPEYFPHSQDVRDFAESLGLYGGASSKREQIVRALARDLSSRDADELDRILQQLVRSKDANALSAWSELIISKEDRS